jgi:Ca2+-binding RTX toxin-like protein
VWQYDIATDTAVEVARHDPARFQPGVASPLLTQDEESSGVIDVSDILGEGHYLADVQAHFNPGDPELVEGGQLLVINTDAPTAGLAGGALTVEGTIDEDALAVTRWGHTLTVSDGSHLLGTFDSRDVDSVLVKAGAGDDIVSVAPGVQAHAVLLGGAGDDLLIGGGGASLLIGGTGADGLAGGAKSDVLVGGTTAHDADDATLLEILAAWSADESYAERREAVGAWLSAATVADDGTADQLFGVGSLDLFFAGAGDETDARPGEAGG